MEGMETKSDSICMPTEIDEPKKPSKWVCYLSGNPTNVANTVTFNPAEENEPCWFHRKMQELCFGFKWIKENK